MKQHTQKIPAFFVFVYIVCVFVPIGSELSAQSPEAQVKSYIAKVDEGRIDDVKKALPDLVSKYQNNAGVMYLQGRLASDGIEAVKFYQSVVDNFPKCEWASDALYRIYQYYYSLGLYRTAEVKMEQLKKDYPNSPRVTGKQIAKLPKQEDAPVKFPTKDPAPVDTQTTNKSNPSVSTASPYTLQMGAFSSVTNAEKQKTFLEDLGYTVEIANKIRSGKSLYLVWMGNFTSADEARTVGKQIKSKYKIDSIIVERY